MRRRLLPHGQNHGHANFRRCTHAAEIRPGIQNGIDYKELSTARPYMFADKPERVVIKLPERLIDDIIDWFGADIKVKGNENGILTVEIVASPNAMQFWAMQYGTYAEIIEPQSLRERIKERLTKMQENYSNNPPCFVCFLPDDTIEKHKNHTETTSLSARRFLSHFVKIIPFFASRKAPLSVIENKIGIITR